MGKIFDALEKFDKEKRTKRPGEATVLSIDQKNDPRPETDSSANQIRMKTGIDNNLVTLFDPLSYESEQFKILRTRLLFPKDGITARTVMVTSALPDEGKTFASANLAISIAQGINDHVLLIDCDMRRPSIHRLFGFGRTAGLSDYLAGGHDLQSLLLKTPVDKLTLLPGGTIPPNPAELLSSHRMSNLLVEVRSRYKDRFIILDTPPPHMTADANALTNQVDGILLVMKYQQTPRQQVEKLVEKLGKEKILGVLVNRFQKPSLKYGGYMTRLGYKK